MASSIAAITTGSGGVVTTADATGNLNLVSGTTTIVAVTSAGAAVTGTLSASGATTLASVAGAAVATQAQQETGTATDVLVTPGRQQYHPSAAKMWLKCNSSATIQVSYNVTSVSDDGPGSGTITIATDFSSAEYAALATLVTSAGMVTVCTRSFLAGSFGWYSSANGVDTASDAANYMFACFGDQA